MEDLEECGVASFTLPPSPVRSPTGSDNMSVWVEDADGEQRVYLGLHSPRSDASNHSDSMLPSLSGSDNSTATSTALIVPGDALDFPLVLWKSRDSPAELPRTSSALVPFQKLRLDTNLNQTTLPYKLSDSPLSGSSTSSPTAGLDGDSTGNSVQRTAEMQLASGFLGMDSCESTSMSQDFMNALRLGDLTQQEEPQLSVRLRGSRVELASASEEEEVDFLGPAENIKRLFKLPYSQSRVSLAVHRVGSTLVVDGELNENDLPAGFEDLPQDTLQLAQQSEEVTQCLLYEKFIYESTVSSQLPAPANNEISVPKEKEQLGQLPHRTTTKNHGKKSKKAKKAKQKTKNQDSATAGVPEPLSVDPTKQVELLELTEADLGSNSSWVADIPPSDAATPAVTKPELPTPSSQGFTHHPGATPAPKSAFPFTPAETNSFTSAAHHAPAFGDSQAFQRILKWKFHDLKMILGSQVLLFSNQEHPAVSLKLHDMDKELSLCTVLDYYLDNVIANIPELAICMHSKGLVRGYKLVETRQIPYMSGTGSPLFDVQDVSMNASMLLKFLQENCSRPNGTYWLHRKEGENSLRLYDVDVLSQGNQLKWKYMMAMLCYRFAARASRLANSLATGTPHLQQQLQQRQRELLRTCMSLLGEIAEKGGTAHSSICSSVSEQLADTYIRECHEFHSVSSTDSRPGDSDREAVIESLKKAKQYLLASIRLFEECIPRDTSTALPHNDDDTNDIKPIENEGDPTSENPDEDEDEDGEMGSFMDEELNRLQLKFSSTCLELGQLYATSCKWTNAVNCIVEASRFLPLSSIPEGMQPFDLLSTEDDVIDALLDSLDFDGVGRGGFSRDKIITCISGAELRCSLLGLIGDMAAQKPMDVVGELIALYDIISGVKRELLPNLCDDSIEFMKTVGVADPSDGGTCGTRDEGLMVLSFFSYLRALSPPVDSELYFLLMKKLGNASNELGKYFLAVKHDYKEAFRWFERGCKIFNDIEDGVNVALLRANLAHLHKIFAQGKSMASREEHYRKAIQLCTDALQLLKQSKADLELKRKVKGELALTYLVWAVDIANNMSSLNVAPSKARENEALKIFNKALSLYSELSDQKQVASTHYQVASFYSRMISSTLRSEKEIDDRGDKSTSTLTSRMEIARRHYEKALDYFGAVEVGKTFVLIHQELADLHILGGRLEGIEHALLILLNTYEAFNLASAKDSKFEKEALATLARDVVAKVKAVLHQLIRLSSGGRGPGSTNVHTKSKKLEMFKKMYKEVIYYDGYSAGSIVPILGTLRGMYTL